MKPLPSFVYAALGVALVVLGVAGLVWGENTSVRIVCVFVGVIGLVQIVFGGFKRTTEDVAATDPTPHTH